MAKMAKTMKVLKIQNGIHQYECILDTETGVYKLYSLNWSFDENRYPKRHRKLIAKDDRFVDIMDFLTAEIKVMETYYFTHK